MPLVKETQPAPVGGVSQVPPELSGPGYLSDAENTFPSPLSGLGVRQGSAHVGSFLRTMDPATLHTQEFSPAPGERYLLALDAAGVKVMDLITGALKSVTNSAPASAFWTALKFVSAVVGDEVYVAGRGHSKAQFTGSPAATQGPFALITVETGQPSALYKITLDGISVSVRTPDDPPPATKRPAVAVNVDQTVNPPTTGSYFTLSPSLWQKIVEAGYSTSAAYTVARGNGFTGAVGLSASAPDGITAAFTDANLSGSETTSTLNITTSSLMLAGIYSIFVTASAPGYPSATSEVRLSVTTNGGPPPADPTIEVVITATPTIVAGSSASVPVTLNRSEGVTSQITLSSIGLTVGSATFSPNPAGTTATMTLAVFSGTTAGSYSFTVRGTTPTGLLDDVTVNFTVPAGSDPAIEFTGSPTSHSVPPDSSTSVTLTLTRLNSFTGDVALAVLWTPPGVTSSPNDATLGSGETTTNLTTLIAATAVPGTYEIPVRASGTGVESVTFLYTLTIT